MNRTSESGRRQSASAAAATAAAYGAAGLSRPDRSGPPADAGAAESRSGEACRCWASPGPPADRGPQPSHGPGVLDADAGLRFRPAAPLETPGRAGSLGEASWSLRVSLHHILSLFSSGRAAGTGPGVPGPGGPCCQV